MRKTKILFLTVFYVLIFAAVLFSCEKKEPRVSPDTDKIVREISEQFPEYQNANSKTIYKSSDKNQELSDRSAIDLFSEKNKPVDLSKLEQYSVYVSDENDFEIGIFKLYDKTNAEYVKNMARTRISKIQSQTDNATSNNAETRSYGNYVYYVSHPEKDKIFEIIEDSLKGA